MIGFGMDGKSPPKCYVTHGTLPTYVDPKEPPSKKQPFSTILNQPFNHTVDLILPQEIYDLVWERIESQVNHVRYSKVILSLAELLEGEFFNSYIKIGNILMLSEGRPGIDNLYYLKDGMLRLELPKEVYERVGLVGKPILDGGRKHIKTRFAIEINLRLPSMLHGKKGFERIVWAFKNVLNHSVTWLFYDFNAKSDSSDSNNDIQPIAKHHPITRTCIPQQTCMESVLIPSINHVLRSEPSQLMDLELEAIDLHEWLGLVGMNSPRVRDGDTIDPYLCRYSVPESESATVNTVKKVTWHGFLPAAWVLRLLLQCTIATKKLRRGWFALSAHGFPLQAVDGKDGFTILRLPNKVAEVAIESTEEVEMNAKEGDKAALTEEYLLWEMTAGS